MYYKTTHYNLLVALLDVQSLRWNYHSCWRSWFQIKKKGSPSGTKHAAIAYRTWIAVSCVICISFHTTIEHNSLGHTAVVLKTKDFSIHA